MTKLEVLNMKTMIIIMAFLFAMITVTSATAQSVSYSPTENLTENSPYSFNYTFTASPGERGVTCDFYLNDVSVLTVSTSNIESSSIIIPLSLAIGGFDGTIYYTVTGFGAGEYNSTVSIPATNEYKMTLYCTSSGWGETDMTFLTLSSPPSPAITGNFGDNLNSCDQSVYSNFVGFGLLVLLPLLFLSFFIKSKKTGLKATMMTGIIVFLIAISFVLIALVGC
jgi:hypothetical protein